MSARVLVALGLVVASFPSRAESPPEERREIVDRYREAKARHDAAAIDALLSDDPRIWFGEKEGEGRPLSPGGRGPWADWDAFFRSESRIESMEEIEGGLRTTVLETNDWYRLVDREPKRYWIDYLFTGDDRIAGIFVHSIPGVGRSPDRLEEFRTWAEAHRPGLMDELMPDGEIDPAKARLWKEALLEWRRAAGFGNDR